MNTADSLAHVSDKDYAPFLGTISALQPTGPLFATDVENLYDVFLNNLPPEMRQEYNCHACRRFVNTYGGVVRILVDEEHGVEITPVAWPLSGTVPSLFQAAVAACRSAVGRATVTGVFLSSEKVWGTPKTGVWRHMALTPPKEMVFRPVLLTADQVAAEKLQDFDMLTRGLAEFPPELVAQAESLLTNGQLYRSEKCVGVAQWLLKMHTKMAATKNKKVHDLLKWHAVATAPAGFCHIRSGMIGTLLEDLQAGLPFVDVKRKFDTKMNPLQYQRPQAAPTAGALAEAEKIVAKLGTAGALERRFARLEDIQEKLWVPALPPAAKVASTGSVFGHLQPKNPPAATPTSIPSADVVMTWEKFQRTVLPGAVKMECATGSGSYYALTATVLADTPPILQWDREEQRNTVAWYTKTGFGGTQPGAWFKNPPTWADVTCITRLPFQWNGGKGNHGDGVVFLLKDCVDQQRAGNALFPETLKSEYHGIRSAIEAYARKATLHDADDASACGLCLRAGTSSPIRVRVTTALGQTTTYKLDRLD